MAEFVEYVLRVEHMLLMVAVSVLISTAQRLLPSLRQSRTWARALPGLPIVLCSVFVWLPGLVDGDPAQKLLLGIVLGSFAGQANKILRQSLLGNDKRIRDHPARL